MPLVVALLIIVFFFNFEQFSENFFGGPDMPEKSLIDQVRDTTLITVFVFIAIEGRASIRAFRRSARMWGAPLSSTSWASLVSWSRYTPALCRDASVDDRGLQQPSVAGALEEIVGALGAVFISIGVLISVLGAYLAWSLICAEVLFAAAKRVRPSSCCPHSFSCCRAFRG